MGRLLDAIAERISPRRQALVRAFRRAVDAHAKRGFNATNDDRLSKNHWGDAKNTSINADLRTDLVEMRNRCRWERQNNGNLEGMAASWALDVVGPEGPKLLVETKDKVYAQQLEGLMRWFGENCDATGEMCMPDQLAMDCRMDWDCGEALTQIVTDHTYDGPIQTRLLSIAPRRCETPHGRPVTDLAQITMGVRRSDIGRPLSYFLRRDLDVDFGFLVGNHFDEIDARFIIHDFQRIEPGQARGIPLMAPCLQVVAALRDWDRDVQQAMRMAAMLGVWLYSEAPGAEPIDLNGSWDLEGGTAAVAPPGYKPMQVTPQQPSQQYDTFRNAKLGEIGRPVGMPLMMVKLDSSDHSYSSARFDGQGYDRTVKARRTRLERVKLNRVLRQVILEAQRARVLRATPADVRYQWIWTPRPHVDPVKEMTAYESKIKLGIASKTGVAAENGNDLEIVEKQLLAEGMQADVITVMRIVGIQKAIAAAKLTNPELDFSTVNWAQILTAGGAVSAPGAYLQSAGAAAVLADPNADSSNPDGPADEVTPKQARGLRRFLSLLGGR